MLHRQQWYNGSFPYYFSGVEANTQLKGIAYGLVLRRDQGHYGNTLFDVGLTASKGWYFKKIEIRCGLSLNANLDSRNLIEQRAQGAFLIEANGLLPSTPFIDPYPDRETSCLFGFGGSIAHNGFLLDASTRIPSWYVENRFRYVGMWPDFNVGLAYLKDFKQMSVASKIAYGQRFSHEEFVLDIVAQYKAIKLGASINDRFVFNLVGSESISAGYNRKLAVNSGLQLPKLSVQYSWINIITEDTPGNSHEIGFAYFFSGRNNTSETSKILNALF